MGAFLDIVRPLNLKRATVIPVTNSVQLLAAHLVVGWEGYLVGNVGSETSLRPLFLPIGWSRSLKGEAVELGGSQQSLCSPQKMPLLVSLWADAPALPCMGNTWQNQLSKPGKNAV